jgi:hypothetical protein
MTAFNAHVAHGMDTFFVFQSAASDCGGPSGEVLIDQAAQYGYYALADWETINPAKLTNTTGVVGWFLSDEGDQNVDDNLRTQLQVRAGEEGGRGVGELAGPPLPSPLRRLTAACAEQQCGSQRDARRAHVRGWIPQPLHRHLRGRHR